MFSKVTSDCASCQRKIAAFLWTSPFPIKKHFTIWEITRFPFSLKKCWEFDFSSASLMEMELHHLGTWTTNHNSTSTFIFYKFCWNCGRNPSFLAAIEYSRCTSPCIPVREQGLEDLGAYAAASSQCRQCTYSHSGFRRKPSEEQPNESWNPTHTELMSSLALELTEMGLPSWSIFKEPNTKTRNPEC